MNQYTFPAGTYYVGDLCYIFQSGLDWDELLDDTGSLGCEPAERHDDLPKGHFHYLNTDVVLFSARTQFGDGSYQDSHGRTYLVDAGLIGVFPTCALPAESILPRHARTSGGNVIKFDEPFTCDITDEDGVITIGHFTIHTGDDFDYDGGGYNDEDDEDDYGWF